MREGKQLGGGSSAGAIDGDGQPFQEGNREPRVGFEGWGEAVAVFGIGEDGREVAARANRWQRCCGRAAGGGRRGGGARVSVRRGRRRVGLTIGRGTGRGGGGLLGRSRGPKGKSGEVGRGEQEKLGRGWAKR
jgi:hypothetical protein